MKKISGEAEEVDYPWKEVEQTRTRDEYLREQGRSNVSWIGDAAGRGFGAKPAREDAHLLLNAKTGGGERLLPKAVVEAIDLTASVSKDVSVLHAVGGREIQNGIDRARGRAMYRMLEKFEEHLLLVRIGSGRRESEREVVHATGLVGIRYEHSYSREGDPQLHDHLLISTAVEDPHGQLRRMWIRDMGELRRTLGYLHEAFLREEISKEFPGIEWEPVQENGTAHIARFPASLRDAMSTRSRNIKQQVVEWEKAHGRRANSAVKQMLTLQTRPAKPDVPDHAQWTRQMIALADHHGFTQDVIEQIVDGPVASLQEFPTAQELADRLLSADGLTARRKDFRNTDVMVAVIQAGVPGSRVEDYVDVILADRRAIAIETLKGITYVTEELEQRERSIERLVVDGIDAVPNLAVKPKVVQDAVESVDIELTRGQREAVFSAASSADRVVLIEAGAGTGKTKSAQVTSRAFGAAGIGVRGAAPTGKAAVELSAGAGIDARTIDSLLWEIDRGGSLSEDGRYRVLILDEAGMAHTRQTARLFEQAEREGMRVIAMGDSNQLTSVAPGGWLGYFTRTGLRPALRLDEIVRQPDRKHRAALTDLARGRPGRWISYQIDRGNILQLGAGQEHQYGKRAADLLAEAADRHGWGHVVAITPTNMRREVINEYVQQVRLARGELGPLLAESGEHEQFHVEDRVMFVGRNDRRRELQNGLIGTVVGNTEQGELLIAVNEKQTQLRTLTAEYVAENLRLAYAVTDYKGQGATVEEAVIVAAPEELDLNRGYVAASRARERTKLVLISGKTPEHALETLAKHLRLRADDDLAIEHIDKAKEANMTKTHTPKTNRNRGTDPQQWLSSHRARIAELGEQLEQLEELTPPWSADRHSDDRLDEISDQRRKIKAESRNDYGLLRAHGRRDRDRARELELQNLKQEETRLLAEHAADQKQASESWDAWTTRRAERRELIELAAKDELEQRVSGKHAPWMYEALGPKPPAEQRGLTQRWYRVGEYLAGVRIDRGITDPVETGLMAEDKRLVADIDLLRGQIQQARSLGSEARRFSLMERKTYQPGCLDLPGLGSGARYSQGHGIGD